MHLTPLDEWQLRYEDDRCAYTRTFGTEGAETYMQLWRLDPWSGAFQMALSSDAFTFADAPVAIAWMPGGEVSRGPVLQRRIDENGREWTVFHNGLWDGAGDFSRAYLDNDGPARFKQQLEFVQVAGIFDSELAFDTGPMLSVHDGLNDCMNEILVRHGIDPADEARSDSRVELKNPQFVVRPLVQNRPEAIASQSETDIISFLLFVDEVGRPTSCRLVSFPYDEGYEDFGCESLAERARFKFKRGEAEQPTFYKVSFHNSM